jgi:hypothetical protein
VRATNPMQYCPTKKGNASPVEALVFALDSEAVDFRASEVAILKFLQAKLAKKAA